MAKLVDNIKNGIKGFRLPERNDFVRGRDIKAKTGERKISVERYLSASFEGTKSPRQRYLELLPKRGWKPGHDLERFVNRQEKVWQKQQQPKIPVGFKSLNSGDRQKALDFSGKTMLEHRYSQNFADHYQKALRSADHLAGDTFLEHFYALRKEAKTLGMSSQEWKSFERFLYKKFYTAAVQDSRQRLERYGPNAKLRVQPHELDYIAKVACVSSVCRERDQIALEQSRNRGELRLLLASNPRLQRTQYA